MGKKGKKSDSATSGKQEVISMAGLEVVSEENFQKRLEGMSSSVGSCVHCIKERSKGEYQNHHAGHNHHSSRENSQDESGGKSRKRRRSNKAKAARIIPRASSPIVVHLEDSIKVSSKNGKTTKDIGKSPLTVENNTETTSKTDKEPSTTTSESRDTSVSKNNRNRGSHGNVHSNSSSKETVVSLNNTQYYSGRSGGHHHHHHHHSHHNQGAYHHHHHHRGCHHLSKNFNAFLSAIERVHQKDPRSTSTRLENLVEFAREKSRKGKFLNNAMVDYCQSLSSLPTSHHHHRHGNAMVTPAQRLRHKSHLHLLNDKNVELICNNLSSRKSSLTESEEDLASCAESSSSSAISSSTNSSSEDNESEVGVSSSSSTCSSSESEELSQEEVRYLSQYVSGFSVTKYDCAPDKCPECLAAYYDFVSACTTPSYTSEQSDSSESETEDPEAQPVELTTSELYPVTVKSDGKVEISVAKLFRNAARSSANSACRNRRNKLRQRAQRPPPNGVFVDLEDSDVSLSIEYPMDARSNRSHNRYYYTTNSSHDNDDDEDDSDNGHHSNGCHSNTTTSSSTGSSNHHHNHYHHHHHGNPHVTTSSSSNQHQPPHPHHHQTPPVPSFWDWFYYPLGTYGWLPYSLPYCLVPMYYLPYQLYSTIPKPIMVPRDTPCLNSQRLCYVPAQEIKNFTASQPPQRPWIPLSHPERNKPIALYTVMCYNVLCDKYATRQLYGYCPSWALNWEYRKKGIIEEIRHYSADIISLQEVETDQFYNFFLPELKRDGYDGIFSPKSRARTMTESERKHVDGCAIFYRTAKFSLIKEHLVEFNQVAMTTADGSHDMLNRVMTKDNIGLAALFETKEAIWENGLPPEGHINQPLLVSTCHVHWDPEFSDVKLIQTMMLMKELKNIVDETQTSFRPGTTVPDVNSIPLILCGDLNSLPGSGVLEYLTTSRVGATHADFKDIGYDACLQKLTNSDQKDVFTHSFKLAAAYSKDMIPYTNYTYDFKGVIDYVFYSRELMRPLGVLGPLDENWFTENKVLGCPHPHIPSDHLPLLVELEMQVPGPSNNQRSNPASIHNISNVRR